MKKITRHVKKIQREIERVSPLSKEEYEREFNKVEREVRKVRKQLFPLSQVRVVKKDELETTIISNDLGEIENRDRIINSLKTGIKELVEKIGRQWNKVYEAYLYCFSKPEEKRFLGKLIKEHIELTKFKKRGFGSSNYYKEIQKYENHCREIKLELKRMLEIRIGRQTIEGVSWMRKWTVSSTSACWE